MANLTLNNMIKFRGFHVREYLVDEIKSALDEVIPVQSNTKIKSVINPHLHNFKEISEMILKMSDEETEKFFNLEDKNDFEILELAGIRCEFIRHSHILANKMLNCSKGELERTFVFNEICQHVIIYKNMILNEEYGLTGYFKAVILKSLEFLNDNGIAQSFLMLCEFCPDFICDDCYPIINKTSKTYVYSVEILNEFFKNLKSKHIEKWIKFFERRE